MKKWIKLVATVAGLLVAFLLVLPFFVNANTLIPALESQLTAVFGRQVKLQDVHVSILSGSLVARDLTVADDPHYSSKPFLQAKSILIGVDMAALIFHRELYVRNLTVEAPRIHLVRAANGSWNFSTIAQSAGRNAHPMSSPELILSSLDIRDGRAVVELFPALAQPAVYEHVNLAITKFSLKKKFPFHLEASLPGGGSLSLTGNAGPINQTDAANTAFDVMLDLKHFDPVAADLLTQAPNLAIIVDGEAHVFSNGTIVNANGAIHIARLQILKDGPPFPKPIDVSYAVVHKLHDNAGRVSDIAVHTGAIVVHLNGTYQSSPSAPLLTLSLLGHGLSIDALKQYLPAAGVKLPDNATLRGGTLTMDMSIVGPPKDIGVRGSVEMSDTTLQGMQLMKHLRIVEPLRGNVIRGPVQIKNCDSHGLNVGSHLNNFIANSLAPIGNVTTIKVLRLNVIGNDAGVHIENLYMDRAAVGEVKGSGTVSSTGALNYHLTLQLNELPNTVNGNVLGILPRLVGKVAAHAVAKGIPVTVTGTSSDPSIIVDLKNILKQNTPTFLQ